MKALLSILIVTIILLVATAYAAVPSAPSSRTKADAYTIDWRLPY